MGELFRMVASDFAANRANASRRITIAGRLVAIANQQLQLSAILVLLLTLALWMSFGCAIVSAQSTTTTISGNVYDPRTTANSLPLPNVLVYATTGTPAALPTGVQCLTTSAPTDPNVVSYTYTAVDGSFLLTNVPENASYTVVIQSGKWRRQFRVSVTSSPIIGLALHMPSNHTQGDIPLIAISTGSVDALECVLLDMGIAQTEFTDDNAAVNASGRIHLYKGSNSAGAVINASTPTEAALMSDAATVNNYDMLMFPCQGGANNQATATGATNLLNYTTAGGRVFATHFSFAWLDPNPPYNAQFPPVANWVTDVSNIPDGDATINTSFNDGATLAQWLLNAGASSTYSQVALTTLRQDISSVVPPTQSWATLNSNGDVMQMTFNTPVGAAAANQCGRVLFNEYHVENSSVPSGTIFPNECPSSTSMTPQEEMLEYALFDLSAFVQPVVVPTLSIAFNPSPLQITQGATGDQVTVEVTNISATTPITASAKLTIALPQLVTATAMTDASGGWICSASTLTCVRSTVIPASAGDSVILTLSVGTYPAGGLTSSTGVITATVSSATFANNVSATDTVEYLPAPTITWAPPAPIVYGTPLSSIQLDASASVAGSFSYSPAAGTVLSIGQHTLVATFTPNDTVDYSTAIATQTIQVNPIAPALNLTASANPVYATSSVTFTATMPSTGTAPTGTVTFFNGTTQIGTTNVASGSARLTTSSLAVGSNSITAAYSGDSNYGATTSSPLTEVVEDFTIAPLNGTSTVTVPAAGTATYSLVITPVGGVNFPAAVNFIISGLPLGATPSMNPASVPTNSSATVVTLQVKLPGQLTADARRSPRIKLPLSMALGLLILPFMRRRRLSSTFSKLMILALSAAAMTAGVSGCGTASVTPQAFPFTVTATSGPLTHSTTLTISVN
jgi:hypothetical protein